MGLFSSIVDKIFRSRPAAAAPSAPSTSAMPGAGGAAAMPAVDVMAVLSEMAKTAGAKLNWKESIVDLLKLLKLDSSLGARKELAKELHYSGDTNDTATMNVWLQKQVMTKLAENGGKVPDDLKA
jgi:hypothetical protein